MYTYLIFDLNFKLKLSYFHAFVTRLEQIKKIESRFNSFKDGVERKTTEQAESIKHWHLFFFVIIILYSFSRPHTKLRQLSECSFWFCLFIGCVVSELKKLWEKHKQKTNKNKSEFTIRQGVLLVVLCCVNSFIWVITNWRNA